MNVEPSWQDGERIWSKMRPLLNELLAAPRSPRVAGKVPAVPGIYLFSHEGYRYVGQTRNLRNRLAQHTRPSGTHNSATLAFSMAVERSKECIVTEGRTREELQADPQFVPYFSQAKADVASWDVQFIRVCDTLVRTVFEVHVHAVLGTDLNSFETH